MGHVSCGKLLREKQAPVDATTKNGETALHLSAEKGKLEFVKMLIEWGADLTILNKEGKSAYDFAKEQNQKEVMVLLKPASAGGCCIVQ